MAGNSNIRCSTQLIASRLLNKLESQLRQTQDRTEQISAKFSHHNSEIILNFFGHSLDHCSINFFSFHFFTIVGPEHILKFCPKWRRLWKSCGFWLASIWFKVFYSINSTSSKKRFRLKKNVPRCTTILNADIAIPNITILA